MVGLVGDGGHSYDYYAYSNSVARVDKASKETEVKSQNTREWVKVEIPAVLKRIQEDGMALRNKEQADTIYENLQGRVSNPSQRRSK